MSKKILIVEDEEYLLDMYKMKFTSAGYDVTTAVNGVEGLELASTGKFDLVLLDLIMPKMNGYQVLDELRSNEATKNLPVYILSNLGQGSEIDQGLNHGANGYLVKSSFTPSQLLEQVEQLLSGGSVNGSKVKLPEPTR